MQASLEAESRAKGEALRAKKKLENDINDLEVAADTANRGRAEAEKMIKKYQTQVGAWAVRAHSDMGANAPCKIMTTRQDNTCA